VQDPRDSPVHLVVVQERARELVTLRATPRRSRVIPVVLMAWLVVMPFFASVSLGVANVVVLFVCAALWARRVKPARTSVSRDSP
jgi:hypothetical protein